VFQLTFAPDFYRCLLYPPPQLFSTFSCLSPPLLGDALDTEPYLLDLRSMRIIPPLNVVTPLPLILLRSRPTCMRMENFFSTAFSPKLGDVFLNSLMTGEASFFQGFCCPLFPTGPPPASRVRRAYRTSPVSLREFASEPSSMELHLYLACVQCFHFPPPPPLLGFPTLSPDFPLSDTDTYIRVRISPFSLLTLQ